MGITNNIISLSIEYQTSFERARTSLQKVKNQLYMCAKRERGSWRVFVIIGIDSMRKPHHLQNFIHIQTGNSGIRKDPRYADI